MTKLSDPLANSSQRDGVALDRHAATVDWDLLDSIRDAAGNGSQPRPLCRAEALGLVSRALNAPFVAWIERQPDGEFRCVQEFAASTAESDTLRSAAQFAASESHFSKRSVCHLLNEDQQIVVNPLSLSGVVEVFLATVADWPLEPALVCAVGRLVILDLFARLPADVQTPENAESRMSAAVLSLAVRLAAASDALSGAKLFTDLVCQHLQAERVAVGRVEQHAMKVRLTALSDVERPDTHSETAKLIEDCLAQSIAQARLVSWNADSQEQAASLGLWPRLAEEWKVSDLTALHLLDRENHLVGICLIAGNHPLTADDSCFISLAAQVAGPLLKVLERGTVKQWLSACRNKLPAWLTRSWMLVAATVICLPLAYPWHVHTPCAVLLEPQVHRLIAAPFEGIFEQNLVLPGDYVQAGQPLGRMDGREIRGRLAAIEADLARATKSRDSNLAGGKLAEAQIDKLQSERYLQERAALTRRLQQVEISSPISGIVVSDDLKRHEGAAVKIGQSLYEVAPLEKLVAEVAIPEEELELVASGSPVTVRLDAFPGRSWEGHVERIHPRAEPRENRQVFIAETTLTNDDRFELRPGMKGTAKAEGPQMPGVWLLARKPFNAFRRFMGW